MQQGREPHTECGPINSIVDHNARREYWCQLCTTGKCGQDFRLHVCKSRKGYLAPLDGSNHGSTGIQELECGEKLLDFRAIGRIEFGNDEAIGAFNLPPAQGLTLQLGNGMQCINHHQNLTHHNVMYQNRIAANGFNNRSRIGQPAGFQDDPLKSCFVRGELAALITKLPETSQQRGLARAAGTATCQNGKL